MENDYNDINSSITSESTTETKSYTSFKDASPEDVKNKVKETVQKSVAAVAGALKGFSEEAKKHNLADATKQAIQRAGETTRQVVGTTAKEFQQTKDHVKSAVKKTGSAGSSSWAPEDSSSSSIGSLGGGMTSSYNEEAGIGSTSMGDVGSLGGSSSLGTSEVSNVRGTSLQENAMQGGAIGSSESFKVPDLRKTELGKSDEQLQE